MFHQFYVIADVAASQRLLFKLNAPLALRPLSHFPHHQALRRLTLALKAVMT